MRVLLDTNVYISFLLSCGKDSAVVRVVQHALGGSFTVLIPDETVAELIDNARSRPYLKERIDPSVAENLVDSIRTIGVRIPTVTKDLARLSRDPADDYLLVASVLGDADYLVTGDKDLLVIREVINRPRIMTAAEFLQQFEESAQDS